LYIAPAILIAPFDSISASTGLSLRISAIAIEGQAGLNPALWVAGLTLVPVR